MTYVDEPDDFLLMSGYRFKSDGEVGIGGSCKDGLVQFRRFNHGMTESQFKG